MRIDIGLRKISGLEERLAQSKTFTVAKQLLLSYSAAFNRGEKG